jgi:hypothetical protein
MKLIGHLWPWKNGATGNAVIFAGRERFLTTTDLTPDGKLVEFTQLERQAGSNFRRAICVREVAVTALGIPKDNSSESIENENLEQRLTKYSATTGSQIESDDGDGND